LLRKRRFARSAISAGVELSSASARSISMPETPNTSLITPASLMPALSSSFERAVPFRGQGADQRLAVTHQLAQHPDVRGWHEARAHQSMADQVGDPLCVLHVRLASGHVTHEPCANA